jgi:ATP-dependent Clp protease ATP-binding subunit ClpX
VLALLRVSLSTQFHGIFGGTAGDSAIRLKAIAYIGWQMTSEPNAASSVEEVVDAIIDSRRSRCDQILLLRDALGRMVCDRSLMLSPEIFGIPGRKLVLSDSMFSWINGGRKSMGDFRPSKLQPDRLRQGAGKADCKLPPPTSAREIYEAVRRKVVGLDPQVRSLATQMSLHLLRSGSSDKGAVDFAIPQAVVVLVGPSGSGKTMIAQSLAEACRIPSVVFDATTLTSEGYIGAKVDDIFHMLVIAARGDVAAAGRASLAVLDEADKLDLRSGREVCSSAVQAELLRPLQGAEFLVGGKRQADGHSFLFNARNVAYILAGCFPDLDKIIERKSGKGSVGFVTHAGEPPHPSVMEALREIYLEEVCNRVTAVVRIPAPDEESLCRATSEGILCGFNTILKKQGIVLRMNREALRLTARFGLDTRTYFRGCKQIVGSLAEELLFDPKPKTYYIAAADVRRAAERLGSGVVGDEQHAEPDDDEPNPGNVELKGVGLGQRSVDGE